jgi:phosphotransferase system enzyme I (PtsI)
LFNQFRGIPSEAEQLSSYRHIAESAGRHGVRIRTFDFSEDDVGGHPSKYKNPALGLRAIRLSLSQEEQFRIQLRALLQAAYRQNLDIIVPMVSDLSEVRRTKEILKEERENLIGDGLHVGNPRIGAMIEVPAAVFSINDIVEEVEFICLGTNDLVQYILAVDRDNESVAKWFNTLNPAVIKAIKLAVSAAEGRGIPCIVCGEMAGSPFYVPLLVGLGATELSMNAGSISRVRRIVEGIAYEEALELASAVEKCRTADEAETVVFENIDHRWAHLFGDEDTRYTADRSRLDGI